ncbi:type II toxin-antitoxin system RelB/DinJ family antitoxin [Patescibacteria group bacterium]|nr:type II toxin-antitoxin system RelB/DinJ family antitoxin [Patescibacteria group bacterium]
MTSTTIRIDEKLKKNAHQLAKTIGFSFSDLINVLLKKAVRDGGVDLRLTENGFTPEFEESILKTHKKGEYEEFESADEMIKHAKKKYIA